MSRKPALTVRTDESTHSAVESLADDRDCSKSEAGETALKQGLGNLGYQSGPTRARRSATAASIGLFHVGATLVFLSVLGSVSLLVSGVAVLASSLGLSILSRVIIPKFEPTLSRKIPTIEVK